MQLSFWGVGLAPEASQDLICTAWDIQKIFFLPELRVLNRSW